ncbi:hypothetical protein DYB32_003444 [Aphanomyces invadans]|uniref:Uncharacterized protein n=1 Tax=Aphanomyces invadans TaxID=157072 RepID=A0A3R6Z147_9STRA|nr:hypothetical protein DYB32_003444 [Aphanomyces invadans]
MADMQSLLEELHQICDIFLLFSQGDVIVKEHMCDLVVLEGFQFQPNGWFIMSAVGLLYSLNPGNIITEVDEYATAMVKVLNLFVMEILFRLSYPKPFVRKNLLKMLKCIFESHTSPVQFLVEYNIHPIIHALAQENNQILIQEIASQLLQAILVSAAVF